MGIEQMNRVIHVAGLARFILQVLNPTRDFSERLRTQPLIVLEHVTLGFVD